MKPWKAAVGALAVGALSVGIIAESGGWGIESVSAERSSLALDAISPDPARAARAIASLRASGPAGLKALFDAHKPLFQKTPAPPRGTDPVWDRLHAAIDAVAAQYDAHASRLYWYTDLARAKRAAAAQGKPILSLRLLGRLDEELSCANSRFFRTVLYPNAEISTLLRESFVLHWQSERPVPKVTIDFGDGRTLRTTLTGNSIHYVLEASGTPVDAIPGLYGPKPFRTALERAALLVKSLAARTGAERQQALRDHHAQRLQTLTRQWNEELRALGRSDSLASDDPGLWAALAMRHRPEGRLDTASRALLESKEPPTAEQAMVLTTTKARIETPLLRRVRQMESSIAADTVRNEYRFHRSIHEWFAGAPGTFDLEQLNARVYSYLFLTPRSDPWLGLRPAGFTGIYKGGIGLL
jgi:hypothetical protein